jgi:hypothetical protein
MSRFLSVAVILIFVFGGIIFTAGFFVGPNYYNERTFVLDYEIQEVWKVLNEIEYYPTAKRDVESVNIRARYGNLYSWEENLKNGGIRIYRNSEKFEQRSLKIELLESSYGVTGVWEFKLKPVGVNTEVSIIERSENSSVFGRGLRFFFGRDRETSNWEHFIRVRLFGRLLTTP